MGVCQSSDESPFPGQQHHTSVFWHWVDKIVGYVPVVGTIKDGVEAVVLECEGKHKEAFEKAMETAVDLACDAVTVASFGEGFEVAVAGKAAAEAAMKDAMESGLKSVAKEQMVQATKDGFTKKAATVIGVAGAAELARIAVKDEIARRAGKAPDERPKPDNKPKEPKKDPKRGHHVINNGVRKVFQKIIESFLEHNAHYFNGESFEELVQQGHILQDMIVFQSYGHPLNEEDDHFIQNTVAFTPEGQVHAYANDIAYSAHMCALRVAVVFYMNSLFLVNVRNRPMGHPEQVAAGTITALINEINATRVYVDTQALEWWLATGGNELQFDEVCDSVANMFQALTQQQANVIGVWVQDLFQAYQTLHNIPH